MLLWRNNKVKERIEKYIAKSSLIIYPPATLVEIENTHNRAGGVIFPQDEIERICATAVEQGIATYLDGARLWNVSLALGRPLHELAAPDAATVVARARELGVLVFAFGPRTLRAVTHLDVSREECLRAADVFLEIV